MDDDVMTLENWELTDNQRFNFECLKAVIVAIDRLTEAIKNARK